MRSRLAGRRDYGTAGVVQTLIVASILLSAPPVTRSDVLYLVGGGSVEGEIIESDAQMYKVRTVVGTIPIKAASVERIVKSPSPFAEYEQRRHEIRDTAAEHTELAQWCREIGLRAERLRHLRRAVELDADFAQARRELGFIRVGHFWVEGRTVVQREAAGTGPNRDAEEKPEHAQAEQQKLADAIRISWIRRIRAIKTTMLDRPAGRAAQQGRERILAIKDPLAIGALASNLSSGPPHSRALLVEALRAFEHDEATLNLAILGLTEPVDEIRWAAIDEVVRRNDPRTVPQYRKALHTRNEAILLRAAEGLGKLEAAEAVPELVQLLTRKRMKVIEFYPDTFFTGMRNAYGVSSRASGGFTMQVARGDGRLIPPDRPQRSVQEVTVYRSEVRQALRDITGQDFGFDRSQWRRWYQKEYKL